MVARYLAQGADFTGKIANFEEHPIATLRKRLTDLVAAKVTRKDVAMKLKTSDRYTYRER